jgi:branched-chain amino acid transport system substrate-binding protein
MRISISWGVAAILALGAGAAQAQISDDVVKIGVLTDMSGLYADLAGPGSLQAAEMAVKDFGGTVQGKPIQVISGDHLNKPDVGAALARQWYEKDKVDMIIDMPNSSVALAVQQIAKDMGKVDIISAAAASDLTGKACSPTGIHWTYDTYALAHGTGGAMVKQGGDTWFFLTADYAFGHALERDTVAVVEQAGGKVLGVVRHPLSTPDFSSFLLQAQGSKAKVIGLANAGGDTINSIKQAAEFGIVAGGQRLAGLLVFISDVDALGLQAAQGLVLTEAFYWDQNDATRAWSKRFIEIHKKPPTMVHAGIYGAVTHYLKAIDTTKTDDGTKVVAKMRELPINDFMTKDGELRVDGRVIRDMYLFEVKKPSESKYPFDYYNQLATIPHDKAFRPLSEGECPLVKKG